MRSRTPRFTMPSKFLFLLAGMVPLTVGHAAGQLKVMHQGLGSGTVTATSGSTIHCGSTCDETFASSPVVQLQATATAGSVFVGWSGDCQAFGATATCSLTMSADRLVRAEFRRDPDIATLPVNPTLSDLQTFLASYPDATTAAHLLRALPSVYQESWVLMTRSESLQTGTARSPRILLPNGDATSVFSISLAAHASYPGSHPNAVELMQWDAAARTFRFHEIVLADIAPVIQTTPTGPVEIFPLRTRGVHADEPRCTRCHSTRNIPNPVSTDRGTSIPTANPPILGRNKPNWDSYDNWPGALPFNRDQIYQGSLEAAAFRRILNPWTWRADVPARRVIEQLTLQGSGATHPITRVNGGARDGTPTFNFDGGTPPLTEPAPVGGGSSPAYVNYSFDNVDSSAMGSAVVTGGSRQTVFPPNTDPALEGRATELFDRLGYLNHVRIAAELADHRFATGGVPLDVRPVALAIAKNCLNVNQVSNQVQSNPGLPALTVDQTFFRNRHRFMPPGMGINQLVEDTRHRARGFPVRKANLQKLNLDRGGDVYLFDPPSPADAGLIESYGAATSQGTSNTVERLRQEVFRIDPFPDNDVTEELEGHYSDQESSNPKTVALLRFFLEPLGVPVDKWSLGARGRSRSYTFADGLNAYLGVLATELEASLSTPGDGYPGLTAYSCNDLIPAVNSSLSALPTAVPPTFTDVQRVFNKGCIECHGGLGYPPFTRFMTVDSIDFSEEEAPASHDRLLRSHGFATALTSNALDASNRIWSRITASGETCGDFVSVMPCGGPPLTGPDIDTIERWIQGGRPNSHGDPHIHTVDGTDYDFQAAGEFTLLRGESLEVQARHTPVQSAGPLPADSHSGLRSCPSITTALALRVGPHRVTYQPNLSGQPDPSGMQLRVDGRLVERLGARGIALSGGGRILPTPAPGGIQIEYPGGTDIVVTPNWWAHYQLWYLNLDVRAARANHGVMGVVAPRNWLPALPGNQWLGARPAALADRYGQIYGKFADAWRVTSKTSLFDYAPGTSTATFTLKGWPKHEAADCSLPAGWAPPVPPQPPIPTDQARKICAGVVDPADFAKCVKDVAATGEAGFAKVYVAAEKIQRNTPPLPVALATPTDVEKALPDSLQFGWKPTSDRDSGKLTYVHCVWPAGRQLDYLEHCRDVGTNVYSTAVSGLRKNTWYYWKVVVDDGQGGIVSSQIRRFSTR